jgi:hypothetical protein
MKRHFLFLVWLAAAGLLLPAGPADGATQFTAKKLDQLDKLGAFPPDFKTAVHDYVNVKKAIVDAKAETAKLQGEVPGLQKQIADNQTKMDALQKVLADYNHTDETDFVLLQNKMNDATAKPQDQLMLAQVFVWSYPTSPHEAQAQAYLQQVQKEIADKLQAEKDAEAAKAAAWAALLQRVQNKDLSLTEWKSFLNNMTQEDVLKYLGPPPQQNGYYWIYTGPWTLDPALNQKVGLELNFNGGRVVGVVEMDPSTTTAPQ